MSTEQEKEIKRALSEFNSHLHTLENITSATILIPGEPQSRYHQIVEEAYAALRVIEAQIDQLRAEIASEHQRLDEIKSIAIARTEGAEEQLLTLRDED